MSARPRPAALLAAALLGLTLTFAPGDAAEAARLRLRASLERYGGNPAYLAIYVTDARGKFVATVQVFGEKVQYYHHLPRWLRGVGPQTTPLDGLTGASVGAGRDLDVTVDLADALLDSGLQLRVDSAAENIADEPAEIILPLERAVSGREAIGRGLIARFRFDV